MNFYTDNRKQIDWEDTQAFCKKGRISNSIKQRSGIRDANLDIIF